jgi:hypothetical protein
VLGVGRFHDAQVAHLFERTVPRCGYELARSWMAIASLAQAVQV